MYILAFETSCDDTSVAIMRDDQCIALSTRTQLEHTQTGWVVPEVAARSHANAIFPCIEDAFRDAHISLGEIDIIACTDKPGLMPSLLTGMTVAKTLAISLHKPLLWVDHIESHIFANYLERKEDQIPFPSIVLTVSGGHTEIYLWRSRFDLSLIGQTRDDAAWEAFDKVSKMIWLGFPGWAIISRRASMYPGEYVWIFPEVLLEKESLDFSFSWLKTAVKREIDIRIQKTGTLSDEDREQIAFEFEEVVIRTLVKKLIRAQEQFWGKSIVLAGWVSANTKLKNRLEEKSRKIGIPFISPVRSIYSMDNAAMVWIRAYYDSIKKQ